MITQKVPSCVVQQLRGEPVLVVTREIGPARTVSLRRRLVSAALVGSLLAVLPAGSGVLAVPVGAAQVSNAAASVAEAGPARLLRTGAEAFKVDDIAGTSGAPLLLKIQLPPNPTVSYSFLMVRNMPPNFTLSAGFGAKGYWAVSLHDIEGLQVIAPDAYEGSFAIEVLLVKGMGAEPERRTANVVLKSKTSAPAVASANDGTKLLTASRPEDATATLPSTPPRQSGAEGGNTLAPSEELTAIDQSMMERGDTYLKQGDIAAARLLYRQLAKKGIARGALAMGHTYDPEVLATLAIRGLQPDIAQAKNWYRMAEELGSAQAAQRLATLNAQGN